MIRGDIIFWIMLVIDRLLIPNAYNYDGKVAGKSGREWPHESMVIHDT